MVSGVLNCLLRSACVRELSAGGDLELGEDLAEMPLDGAWAQEQPGRDLWVGQAFADQTGDLGLLGGEFAIFLDTGVFANGLTGGSQLAGRTLGECLHPHRAEHLMRNPQLFAGISPAA